MAAPDFKVGFVSFGAGTVTLAGCAAVVTFDLPGEALRMGCFWTTLLGPAARGADVVVWERVEFPAMRFVDCPS